jgi:hypothetical protein
VLSERLVGGSLGSLDRVVVVAHADDLGDSDVDAVEAVDDGRVELHRVRLAVDVRAVWVADVPVPVPIQPDREVEGLE